MTKVIVRVHPLYLMNVVQTKCLVPGDHQPLDQANCLVLSTLKNGLLPRAFTITFVIITQLTSRYSVYHPTEVEGRDDNYLVVAHHKLLKGIMVRLTCYYTIHLHALIP